MSRLDILPVGGKWTSESSTKWLSAQIVGVVTVDPVADIHEIQVGRTELAAAAMLTLRPRWETRQVVVELIDTRLRPAGYRLVGLFESEAGEAASVIGFRPAWSSAWGQHLYVDDVSTLPESRGHGYADLLIQWVVEEARRLNCEGVHLDSGLGPTRSAAHRLYLRNHFHISAHHFEFPT
ncbi:GNAT family N-acetyltransferase [Nocardia brasiliensis]|uniref:GNAT family N-acetyltransferase n=1 Tax=Nocardia brasiliensis TaxID=37326 RepID=UPI001E2EAD4E|nr:GNAT family N-acetyltransferase [Nocardia brasiliensis]